MYKKVIAFTMLAVSMMCSVAFANPNGNGNPFSPNNPASAIYQQQHSINANIKE